MVRCWIARRNLTAWLDGELREPRARRVHRHLSHCSACSVEAERLRTAVNWQRRTFPRLLAVGDLDTMSLQSRLQSALSEQRTPILPRRIPLFRPILVTSAAVMAGLILLLLSLAGGPNAV